jgi:hypothetical protein
MTCNPHVMELLEGRSAYSIGPLNHSLIMLELLKADEIRRVHATTNEVLVFLMPTCNGKRVYAPFWVAVETARRYGLEDAFRHIYDTDYAVVAMAAVLRHDRMRLYNDVNALMVVAATEYSNASTCKIYAESVAMFGDGAHHVDPIDPELPVRFEISQKTIAHTMDQQRSAGRRFMLVTHARDRPASPN